MALIVADRVQETTNSTGTGAYTLGGAVPGFQTFASEVSNADTVYYSITDNVDFEVGLGTYASSGGTITRTTVFTSSNSNSAVNWGVGTKNIFLTYPADKAVVEDASNNVTIGNNLVVGGTVDGRDVAADGTKLDFVTVTQAVNLDQMETDIAALENGMVYKGDWNAGSGSFPGSGSAQTGWFYYVSGAGTVNGISFTVGDNIVATTDNASTSTYASNWSKHDQTDAVQAVVGLTGSIAKGSLLSALNVEDGADVTDTANVTSAGALMDSEVTNLAQVKAFNSSDYATAAQGTTADNALPKAGGTMSGNIDGNGNKMLFANMYSNLVDLPSATTYHGMFAHVHATGKAYFAHSGAWVPLANESTTLALAGGTMTGDVLYNDNVKAKFGAGSDLEIYHDGSNSYVSDVGTGQLNIQGTNLYLKNGSGSEVYALFQEGANNTYFYYNGSPKLSITSTGVQVSGNISNATGDFTLDVAGNIILDADGGAVQFLDGGTGFGEVFKSSSNMVVYSSISNGDMKFMGNDGGSNITALTLDMSAAGAATFNDAVKLGDGNVLSLGVGNDLEIYSDGTNGQIAAQNGNLTLDVAGDINFDAGGTDIYLKTQGNSWGHFMTTSNNFYINSTITDGDIVFQGVDGGSTITALTLDMSAAGAATFNSGITVGGTVTADGVSLGDNETIRLGVGDDLQILHDGSNSIIKDVGTGNLQIRATNFNLLNADGNENYMSANDNGNVNLYYDNAVKLATTSSGVTVTGTVAATSYTGDGSNLTGISDTTYSAGSGLDLSGTTFSVESDLRGDVWLMGRDNNDYIAVNPTEINFVLDNAVDMRLDGNADLHVEGNVIAYSTTISDERLKKDIVKIDNALDKVSQLNGYTFEYLADGKKSAGVIAQEVEKVMPSAITESTLPLKMGDDNETQYMTVQYDQLMGLMVEAIKELKAEIEELKAR